MMTMTARSLMGLVSTCKNLLKITAKLTEKDDELEARIVVLEARLSKPQDNILSLVSTKEMPK